MKKIFIGIIMSILIICLGNEQKDNLPYPSITNQYSSLMSSCFNTNSGFGYEYPFLGMNTNIGSFLVLSGALAPPPPQEKGFGINPNINYTIRYYREPEAKSSVNTDTKRAGDPLVNLPMINNKE